MSDSLVTWARMFGRGERVEFHCASDDDAARGHRAWKPVRVPGCVADLGLHVPVELLALGVESIAVDSSGCADPERLVSRLDEWRALFALVGRELVEPEAGRRRREVLDAEAMPTVERRALFGLGRKEPTPEQAWAPDLAATDHQRLRAALRQLGAEPGEAGEAEGPGLLLTAHDCRAAGQCVTACPQGALRLVHTSEGEGQRSELRFDVSLCNACGRCIEFCDYTALSSEGAASLNDLVSGRPVTIATVTTRRCERCRASFSPEDEDATLCPVCAERRANPFGSSLPPEAIERLKRLRDEGLPPPT